MPPRRIQSRALCCGAVEQRRKLLAGKARSCHLGANEAGARLRQHWRRRARSRKSRCNDLPSGEQVRYARIPARHVFTCADRAMLRDKQYRTALSPRTARADLTPGLPSSSPARSVQLGASFVASSRDYAVSSLSPSPRSRWPQLAPRSSSSRVRRRPEKWKSLADETAMRCATNCRGRSASQLAMSPSRGRRLIAPGDLYFSRRPPSATRRAVRAASPYCTSVTPAAQVGMRSDLDQPSGIAGSGDRRTSPHRGVAKLISGSVPPRPARAFDRDCSMRLHLRLYPVRAARADRID